MNGYYHQQHSGGFPAHFLAVSNPGPTNTNQNSGDQATSQTVYPVQYVDSVARVGTPSAEQIVYSNGQTGSTM